MADAGHPEDGWREASPWYQWGPYLVRAGVGLGPRGLQRRRRRLELVPARPRPLARVPLERGRDGRHHRRVQPAVPGLCAVERRGPDPQGADVRADQPEGNHGEDVKDYWWYLDALPSSAWLRWRYHYPQAAFPYEDLIEENARALEVRARVRAARHRRLRRRPLLDRRGPLREGRPDRHPDADHRPQPGPGDGDAPRPADPVVPQRVVVEPGPAQARAARGRRRAADPGRPTRAGRLHARGRPRAGRHARRRCCSARTRRTATRIDGEPPTTPYPKDGINDHVVRGAATVNPDGDRDEGRALVPADVPAGGTAEIRLRLPTRAGAAPGRRRCGPDAAGASRPGGTTAANGRPATRSATLALRGHDAPARGRGGRVLRGPPPRRQGPTRSSGSCARRSPGCSGASSTTATTWRAGSTATRASRRRRASARRLGTPTWRHFDAADILSMPDPWEYPWFAAWDLAFHAVTLAHIDPAFAKYQLLLLCREWFQHPRRGAARLRVVVRRRQPAGPRRGRAARLDDRRAQGRRFLQADLPQAAAELHLVAEPPGQGGQRPVLGRLPRPRQHRRLRPVAPARRDGARAVRRDRLDVHLLPVDAPHRDGPGRERSRRTRTS